MQNVIPSAACKIPRYEVWSEVHLILAYNCGKMNGVLVCLAALVVSTEALGIIGRTQSAGVKGILMCNKKPAANVKVKLYDDDRGSSYLILLFFTRNECEVSSCSNTSNKKIG